MLDAKTASSLEKIIPKSNFKKKVNLAEKKAQWDDRFLRGRQITFVIYVFLRVAGTLETILDYFDLIWKNFHGNDIQ